MSPRAEQPIRILDEAENLSPEAEMAEWRKNADKANDGTPRGRAWSKLLHAQLDLREAGDEEAEDYMGDLFDILWKQGHLSP